MSQGEIVVRFDVALIGAGVFWRGAPGKIGEIAAASARKLAGRVASDGVARQEGVWTISLEKTPNRPASTNLNLRNLDGRAP